MNSIRPFFLFFAFIGVLAFAVSADAQRRDFLTDQELDIVRDAQDIDTRIEVLIKMIDRRFALLNAGAGGWEPKKKESEKWGEAPKGTKLELLDDVKKLLQKAIDDIDNLYEHPDSAPIRDDEDKKGKKRDPQRFGIAVRDLAAACTRYVDPIRKLYDGSDNGKERGVLTESLNFCGQIIEASSNLAGEAEKTN